MSETSSAHRERFGELYDAHFDPLLGYALRRVARPADAADVVSEVFLVAWRRLGEVPAEPESRLWLYGVARRTLANHQRSERRRDALGERLRHDLETVVPDHAASVATRQWLDDAVDRLAERDQEVLRLAAWEELEPREIAVVLGVSTIAVRSRLSRSRARLRALATPAGGPRPEPDPPRAKRHATTNGTTGPTRLVPEEHR